MTRFIPVPITQREAFAFIANWHRHHTPPRGDVFRLAFALDGDIIAVACVGRPVARRLQDGVTAEVTRLCVRDDLPAVRHVASSLYAACWRIAREMGYRRLITYTREDETGASVAAAGWRVVYSIPGKSWARPSRPRDDKTEIIGRTLWEVSA